MRVAHLLRKYNPSEWGGTETAVLQLARAMESQGVGSAIYAPALSPNGHSADPFAASGFAINRFRASIPIWGISQERKTEMIAVGGNVISFDLARSLYRERDVDVIHSHAQGRLGAIGRVVARARRLPFVLSIHGGAYDLPATTRAELARPAAGGWDWGKPLGLMLGARDLMSQADAILTLNPKEAALIRKRHPDRWVISESHGIPTRDFVRDHRAEALEAFPEIRNRPVLLVLGRIDPTKNQEWVVAEIAELVRRHPDVLVVLAGACTNREYGRSLDLRIARGGFHQHVLVAGALPSGDPRLVGLLQLSRALVLPSLSETFGLVILESWAAGTPVISSRTSGASGLIEEGRNGLLFDLESPASFHRAVDHVLYNPAAAREMGEAGRAKAVGEYDTGVCAGKMRRLYEQLVEEKNALRHTAG
ncbi:MAG TPA: glycosyltransferase family 4 protein [Opitutaceae bacterium]|jgi:glycosyltransferase involved in cell wall biosynthesis|nr:glycosyltransferase family 4 protein [Opitutaceae bacterium]